MDAMDIIVQILMLLAGLGIFLFGMKVMGDNLESVAGNKLRKIFDKISSNRFVGMGVGAGVTAVIQSSSATTVMVVGFVNAGVMTLTQAAPIIMGANIGTTITAQIASLKALNITMWFAALTCVGAFMMLSKKDVLQKIGSILAGLGMIFVGLEWMSDAMKFFGDMPAFRDFFANTTNPFLLLLMGMAFTALIQSSSATTGILISMAGVIPLKSAMFVTLGINIGTCITAAIAAIGTSRNAQRAAIIHFMFNTLGAIIFFPIVQWAKLDVLLERLFSASESQIAMFHTIFNVLTTIVLIPFVKFLVIAAKKIIPDKKKKNQEEEEFEDNKFKYIDNRLLSTPVIAINQTQKELTLMSEIAGKNLKLAIASVIEGKRIRPEKFDAREKQLNFLNKEITSFLVNISSTQVSLKDELMIASFYHVASDIERIGDYAENIMEYADELNKMGTTFSPAAIAEINQMYDKVNAVHAKSMEVFNNKDISMLSEVAACEDEVDDCQSAFRLEHIARLNTGECTSSMGAVYINLISNMERIADHMENIARSVTAYSSKPKKVSATIKDKEDN